MPGFVDNITGALRSIGQPQTNFAQAGGYSPAVYQSPYVGLDAALGNPSIASAAATPVAGVTDPTFMQSLLGYTNQNGMQQQGWGSLALGAAQGLGNAWMGMKQYGLAKDSLKENKRQFNINYEAQRKLTNSQLEDRQRARVAANPGAYQSVGDYMNKNGI